MWNKLDGEAKVLLILTPLVLAVALLMWLTH
jgi:hypothetical protein